MVDLVPKSCSHLRCRSRETDDSVQRLERRDRVEFIPVTRFLDPDVSLGIPPLVQRSRVTTQDEESSRSPTWYPTLMETVVW